MGGIWKWIVGALDLGKLGKKAEDVGENAVKKTNRIYACTSWPHLTYHLITYFVLEEGNSTLITSEITEHTKTNIGWTDYFCPI